MADIFNLTDTWNAGGTTFDAIKVNVTNTASAADSKLLNFQIAGLNKAEIAKDGAYRAYNFYTDASNYERGGFDWTSTTNALTIGTTKAGTGTLRPVFIVGGEGGTAYGITLKVTDASGYIKFDTTGGIDTYVGGVFTSRTSGGTISLGAGVLTWSVSGVGFADVGLKGGTTTGLLEVNTGTAGNLAALRVGTLRRSVPVTKTGDFTVGDTDSYIILNKGSAGVVTLPAAATYPGREISFTNIQAFAWTSASANVVPRVGGAAANAMLAATDGAWCKIVSDGTNWIILQGTP